jgi:hypothetical protein
MTVERAKELLSTIADKYTDEEIERILNFYTAFATIVIDQALEEGH